MKGKWNLFTILTWSSVFVLLKFLYESFIIKNTCFSDRPLIHSFCFHYICIIYKLTSYYAICIDYGMDSLSPKRYSNFLQKVILYFWNIFFFLSFFISFFSICLFYWVYNYLNFFGILEKLVESCVSYKPHPNGHQVFKLYNQTILNSSLILHKNFCK